jgi:hypothetical protein
MARWQIRTTAGFADMPEPLRHVDADSPRELKQAREDWLEEHGLTLVDYFGWLRARRPGAALRPPTRRKWLSPRERAELDERLEREGLRW